MSFSLRLQPVQRRRLPFSRGGAGTFHHRHRRWLCFRENADPNDAPATRAVENGYTTAFTEDDACGLYVARGTQTLYSNVKLTAERDAATGDLVWKSKDNTTLVGDCRMSTTTSTIPTKRI